MDIFNKKKIEKLENKIHCLEQDIVREKNNVETYKDILRNSNCSSLLLEENQKLIKWIQSILEQFGTMDVYERRRVYIPVYRKLEPPLTLSRNDALTKTKVKTIVIPEIVIQEMK